MSDIKYNKMNKLSVNVAASGAVNNLLAVESACSTPRTPEILNSLIAMTNPLDNYTFNNNDNSLTSTKTMNNNNGGICPSLMTNESSNSSGSNTIETSPTSPPSVQHMCSQLIKAGLKLSIQSKRKHSSSGDSSAGGQLLDLDLPITKKRRIVTPGPPKDEISEDDDYERSLVSPNQGLTPEDEERRRRRRERNKIAATKCRLKKREKTVNLVYESETLETQNIELKTQIQELETQRRRLVDMLSMHTPSCMKVNNNNRLQYNNQLDPTNDCFVLTDDSFCHTTDDNCQQLPPVTTLSNAVLENALASYDRPASVDISTLAFRHQQTLNAYNRPASVGIARNDQYDTKPPNIVVSSHDSFTAQLTNLDNPGSPFTQYSCHNFDSTTNTGPTYTTGMDNGCMA